MAAPTPVAPADQVALGGPATPGTSGGPARGLGTRDGHGTDAAAPALSLGILASGTGSILEAVVASDIEVTVVVADRPCRALEIASDAGIPSELVGRDSFGATFDREAYTARVIAALDRHHVDVVAMAGFGTILSPQFFARFPGRALNTHPALLPEFKGWHAVRQALEAGVAVTGTTVHIATEHVDDGPVLAQEKVPVLPGDTEESLHERIKSVERRLYPETIRKFMARLES